jgi:hypothetical protein
VGSGKAGVEEEMTDWQKLAEHEAELAWGQEERDEEESKEEEMKERDYHLARIAYALESFLSEWGSERGKDFRPLTRAEYEFQLKEGDEEEEDDIEYPF